MAKPTKAELQQKIETLKNIGETERAAELEAELAAMTGEKTEVVSMSEVAKDEFVLAVTQAEFEKASSKFAAVGKHLSEAGAIYYKTDAKTSVAIPFTIIEEGPDHNKEGEIICGVSAKAVWKLKQTLEALGVEFGTKVINGIKKPYFDANQIPGKQFYSEWTEQVDTRTAEQGGKGGKYSKPTSAISLTAVDSSVL